MTRRATPLSESLDQVLARAKATAQRSAADEEFAARQRASDETAKRQEVDRCRRQLAQDLGPRYEHQRCRIETFLCTKPEQTKVCGRLADLLADPKRLLDESVNLVFLGTVGTGKDHLLAASLYRMVYAGHTVRWVNGQELYGQFRDRMDTGDTEEELFNQLVSPAVLGISDPIPPSGEPSAYNLAQLYRLFDRRYRALKLTWVSLNALSLEDADAKLTAPVFDRLRDGAEVFQCFWASHREQRRRK